MAQARSGPGATATRRSPDAASAVGVPSATATTTPDWPGKVIRDSFTMPAADYALIGLLKKRCIGLGVAIKKSELLRAGLATLARLPDESLATVVAAVESVKTGRPPGKKKRKKKKGTGKRGKKPRGAKGHKR